MSTKKSNAAVTRELTAFELAWRAVAESGENAVKLGRELKAHAAALLKFENGADSVKDAVAGLVRSALAAEPRPVPPAGVKRTADPVCVAWDAKFKRTIHNPGVQVNAALEEAGAGIVLRISAVNGTVTPEKITPKAEGPKVPGVDDVRKYLAKVPYSATMNAALLELVDAWKLAGVRAQAEAAKAAESAPAPADEMAALRARIAELEAAKAAA